MTKWCNPFTRIGITVSRKIKVKGVKVRSIRLYYGIFFLIMCISMLICFLTYLREQVFFHTINVKIFYWLIFNFFELFPTKICPKKAIYFLLYCISTLFGISSLLQMLIHHFNAVLRTTVSYKICELNE